MSSSCSITKDHLTTNTTTTTNNWQPATCSQQSADSNQQPTTSNQHQTATAAVAGSSGCAPRRCLNRRWCEPRLAADHAPDGAYTLHLDVPQTLHRQNTPCGPLLVLIFLPGCSAAARLSQPASLHSDTALQWTSDSQDQCEFILASRTRSSGQPRRPKLQWIALLRSGGHHRPKQQDTRPWTSHRMHLRKSY